MENELNYEQRKLIVEALDTAIKHTIDEKVPRSHSHPTFYQMREILLRLSNKFQQELFYLEE